MNDSDTFTLEVLVDSKEMVYILVNGRVRSTARAKMLSQHPKRFKHLSVPPSTPKEELPQDLTRLHGTEPLSYDDTLHYLYKTLPELVEIKFAEFWI